MDCNLTIVIFLVVIFILWAFWFTKKPTLDDILIQNYPIKSSFKKRIVLVIESFNNLDQLLTLIRNILNQEIKVNSIILISDDVNLNKVKLIQNTCVLNKMGGLSFLLKESNNNTILLFIFPDGFNAFDNPQFLNHFLNTNEKTNGIIMVETNSINVAIDKVYK